MAVVHFLQFLNQGTGRTGRALGQVGTFTYIQNGVELQFEISPAAEQQYRNLRPAQWAGPEVVWVKLGSPIADGWTEHSRSRGTGSDDPEPQNVRTIGALIAYFDSPGPNVASFLTRRPSRIHVVQNFTGWIVGDPVGGGAPERLCEVAAWHSVVSIADQNWSQPSAVPQWVRVFGNRSGTGWADTAQPPAV